MASGPQFDLINMHTRHSIDLLRISEDLNNKIQPHLTVLNRELIAELASHDLTKWRRQRLESILAFSRSIIPATYVKMDAETGKFNAGVAGFEQSFTTQSIKSTTGITMGATLTEEQLAAIVGDTLIEGAPSSTWWSRQDVKLQNSFADQMRQGFLRGEGIGKLSQRVRSIMPIQRRDADALARTSIMSVSNEVREQLIEDNSDITNGYVHVSTLDNRTSFVCIGRDNLKWNNKREPVGHKKPFRRPPLHWNCRSTLIPWLKSFQDLGAKFKAQVPEGTRASMNGAVPRGLSYPDWLKTQTKATQLEVLGAKRLELWDKGEGSLSLRQLVDQRGRSKTLDELWK